MGLPGAFTSDRLFAVSSGTQPGLASHLAQCPCSTSTCTHGLLRLRGSQLKNQTLSGTLSCLGSSQLLRGPWYLFWLARGSSMSSFPLCPGLGVDTNASPCFLEPRENHKRGAFPKTFPCAQQQETKSAPNRDGHGPGLMAQAPRPVLVLCWDLALHGLCQIQAEKLIRK